MIGLLRQRVTEVSLEFYNKFILKNADKIMFFLLYVQYLLLQSVYSFIYF